ncbi:MAG: hypothetical protein RL120_17600 [Gammaproteobacteria bacterium]
MTQPISRSLLTLLALLVMVLLLFGYLGFNKWRFDQHSRELVISLNQAVLASGDAQALIDLAHDTLLQQMDSASLQGYISSVAEILGPLQSISAVSGATAVSPLALLRGTVTASYAVELVFAAEQTRALVELERDAGRWQVTSYVLESPLLYN